MVVEKAKWVPVLQSERHVLSLKYDEPDMEEPAEYGFFFTEEELLKFWRETNHYVIELVTKRMKKQE